MSGNSNSNTGSDALIDSPEAWTRLWVALAIMTIGAVGMYVGVVILPALQSEFGVSRAQASMPYTAVMLGFGVGGILMGRLGDRYGVALPLISAALCIGLGFLLSGLAPNLWTFTLAQGVLVGFLGSSATFGPLLTEMSFWFQKRRGIAVAVCASGNYLGGAIWPPVTQWLVEQLGWRQACFGIAAFCVLTLLPLTWWLRRGTAHSFALREAARQLAEAKLATNAQHGAQSGTNADTVLGVSPRHILALLTVAGFACCVAMAMPQVHIVAYCNDLGFGVARGAQMLSVMLGFGIVSRLVSGMICDRIGGLRTLLLGSALQGIALFLFLPANSMVSLFVISALFGLFQGGIVPSYTIIVRELFPPRVAGAFVGTVIMATLVGMAFGGWASGKIFDWSGSYQAAFVHGIAWNALNLCIAWWLLNRQRHKPLGAPVPT